MIRRKTNEKGEALLEGEDEFGEAAEDIGLTIEDMKGNLNAIESIVGFIENE